MKNAHVSFVSVPIGSHLNQTLPLVETLTRRGYHVSYAVAEPFRARVEAAGAEPIRLHLETLTASGADELSFCRVANYSLPRIGSYYEKNRPAVVIYDFTALAARILTHRNRIPAISTSPHFAMSRAAVERQIPHQQFRELVLAASARANSYLAEHGIDDADFLFFREQLNIHLFPREFEPVVSAIDDTCFHGGRCPGEQTAFGEWTPRNADGKPVVLVALSTSYLQNSGYLRTCVEAFSELKWHVVLSVGEKPELGSLESLPNGFEIVQRTSHTKILPHASLIVCMGGMATASEAAYHGVPMIVSSRGQAELEWLGDNFSRMGVAIHIGDAEFKPEILRRTAVEILQNTVLLERVGWLQHCTRRSPGAEETVNRIEEYIRQAAS